MAMPGLQEEGSTGRVCRATAPPPNRPRFAGSVPWPPGPELFFETPSRNRNATFRFSSSRASAMCHTQRLGLWGDTAELEVGPALLGLRGIGGG